ncbi:glycosyltransferase family 4 protein [Rhodothermus profundi]|uniref:Glycosyltransferase involved in cell wall bisynthesis n=1 Tax=Rhodothermus profundi TaxID=633813 RepID=A0A1M6PJZ8_9BACT|nr:glycosyltransferase family 4 protein [Rhodothermus profundi]SHK08238.1 Glycosyltransferase involved in cell wall bisynthesis [Rhodothermus profundi]
MRIGLVTAHRYPTPREIRLTKLAYSLDRMGHECIVFCPGHSDDKEHDLFDYGRILRRISAARPFSKIKHISIPFNPSWTHWLEQVFQAEKLDLVITRDLRLSLPAITAAHHLGIPAILDIAEHYPGLMQIVSKGILADVTYRNPLLIAWLERFTIQAADQVWVVCEENAHRLRPYAKELNVIENYPLLSEISQTDYCQHRPYGLASDPVRIVSFGLINEIRGLDLAIDAFAIVHRHLPATRLVIFGDGPLRPTLEKRAHELGVASVVEFRGFVSPTMRYRAMSEGDIGIIFHRVCELTNHTMPNKIYDYLSVGLPVCATPMKPVVRFVNKEGCGIIVEEDPHKVAEGLMTLILDHEKRKRMGEAGRNAIRERYFWECQEDLLENIITKVMSK